MARDAIVYERGWNIVVREGGGYQVLRHTITHGVFDCAFALNNDGLSLAKARVDYLFKTHGDAPYAPYKKKA